MRVWIDNWQMQCCGKPLTVGAEASFDVMAVDRSFFDPIFGRDVVSSIDWAEERHSPELELQRVSGRVTGIEGAFYHHRLRTDGRLYEPIAGSGRTERLESADGDEQSADGHTFMGYIVEIS